MRGRLSHVGPRYYLVVSWIDPSVHGAHLLYIRNP